MQIIQKKFVLILALFLIFILPFSGCSSHSSDRVNKPLRVVTQVDISFQNGPIQARRHYSSSEKMSVILNYLRLVNPYGTPSEDPENADGSLFRIQLTYSDGSSKVYLQKSDRYMRIDDGPWKSVDPNRASGLSELLGKMQSDPDEI